MLQPMKLLVAIVEQESLNKAADELQLSQPALSRQLGKLEGTLGVTLFQRRGKRLVLTRVGQIAYEYARKFIALEQAFDHALTAYRTSTEGYRLSIGASLTTLQLTLPNILSSFMQQHPATEVEVHTGKTHEIVQLAEAKRIDLGVIASRVDHPELVCLPLFEDHLCLVAPAKKAEEWGDGTLTLGALDRLPMVIFSKDTWYRLLLDKVFAQHGIYPDVRMEIDSFEAIARLVAAGGMISLLPKSYLREGLSFADYSVWEIPELTDAKRTTSLIYPAGETIGQAAARFVETAVALYRQQRGE